MELVSGGLIKINITNDKQLAGLIADHLPISLEDAERFIDAIKKGYLHSSIDYAITLSYKDKLIERLLSETQALRSALYNDKI